MTGQDTQDLRLETLQAAPDVCELRIEGSLDWSNFERVENAIQDVFKRKVYKLIINLRGARYISSAGYGCFISSLETAMKQKGDIVFAAVPHDIRDVFNILGLTRILRFADDEKAALAMLRKPARAVKA